VEVACLRVPLAVGLALVGTSYCGLAPGPPSPSRQVNSSPSCSDITTKINPTRVSARHCCSHLSVSERKLCTCGCDWSILQGGRNWTDPLLPLLGLFFSPTRSKREALLQLTGASCPLTPGFPATIHRTFRIAFFVNEEFINLKTE